MYQTRLAELDPHTGEAEILIGAASLGVAIFQTGLPLITSGNFSSEATTVNYVHERTPPHRAFRSCVTEFQISAHHPRLGFGRQRFWFRLSFEFNGNDLRNVAINALVHRSSSMISSTFAIRFVAQPYSVPSDPVAEILFQISGRWDPIGRGDVSFWGELSVRADGRVRLTVESERNWVRHESFTAFRCTGGAAPPSATLGLAASLPGASPAAALAGIPCYHGRWCGPGCSGPGTPIDDVDACCKTHDACYGRRGYFNCDCDRELLRCLGPLRNRPGDPGTAARRIYGVFAPKVRVCDWLGR
jgi:hypothetical protein